MPNQMNNVVTNEVNPSKYRRAFQFHFVVNRSILINRYQNIVYAQPVHVCKHICIRLCLPCAIFGGKTQPENMINDVQQTEGCLIYWSTSYALYTAYKSETVLIFGEIISFDLSNASCFLHVLVQRQKKKSKPSCWNYSQPNLFISVMDIHSNRSEMAKNCKPLLVRQDIVL